MLCELQQNFLLGNIIKERNEEGCSRLRSTEINVFQMAKKSIYQQENKCTKYNFESPM